MVWLLGGYDLTKQANVSGLAARTEEKFYMNIQVHKRVWLLLWSYGGMAGKEARAAEKRPVSILASKWDCPYSKMVCFVKSRMSLSNVRLISMLMLDSRSFAWKLRALDNAARAAVTSQRW